MFDIASCLSGHDPDALPVPVARQAIARLLPAPPAAESVPLRESLGRVLAEDIVSGLQVPPQDNAAMDGYALRGTDLAGEGPTRLTIAGTSLAGDQPAAELPPGHCRRIMTGAAMPDGLDTVVPQEFVQRDDTQGCIVIPAGVLKPGANRRLAGEDLALGEVALRAGRRLAPADLGLMASLGKAEVPVRRRLRVAILATGDELRPVGTTPLPPGCIYDSNRHTMWAMLQRLGVCEVLDHGVVADDPAALRAAFTRAAAEADVVISSGGVSVGEADHTKAVMAELGEVLFWKLAMRPGRPLAIGRIGEALLFGLPGNPVAVMVSFYAFVREALLALAGATPAPLPLLRARLTSPLRKKAGRTEYQRGIVGRAADGGGWQVEITGSQGSGVLSSMSRANGLLVLDHAAGDLPAGAEVDVIPFEGLI
ncbi:gephyrin-like molybdotransferase Glp [Pelomonas sp. KK5]|uniref:molybdopterin molybdotransferase MoeA n=1 Tax=Pelomonas sp. KK5 TaxID=1855730 RepID=UPI00097BD87F|nr:gephyrin-like molybdotransferase Glp [Pelomonas sp. KK5]